MGTPKTSTTRPPRRYVTAAAVLVLREKHDNRYFHIPSDEVLFEIALQIVKERKAPDMGYYYPPTKPDPCDLTEEGIKALPESLKKDATRKWNEHVRETRAYNADLAEWESLLKALKEKDGRVAWNFIQSRGSAEYEGYELRQYENARHANVG